MYVCQVKVNKLERAATWAVCWTRAETVDGQRKQSYHARVWGSETVARQYATEVGYCLGTGSVFVVKVVTGPIDQLWIHPATAKDMTVASIGDGWYYAMCYTTVIGDEVRKVCDQTQDDVQSEATARP